MSSSYCLGHIIGSVLVCGKGQLLAVSRPFHTLDDYVRYRAVSRHKFGTVFNSDEDCLRPEADIKSLIDILEFFV